MWICHEQKIICVPRVGVQAFARWKRHLTRRLTFDSGKSGAVAREHACVGGELAAVGGDGQHIVFPRVHFFETATAGSV